MDTVRINGNEYNILCRGEDGPVIVLGSSKEHENYAETVFSRVCEITEAPFVLCVFEVSDWDGDYSPWAWTDPGSGRSFSGKGPDTLKRLENDLIPYLKEHFEAPLYIAGYSLAGLFALWAMYESNCFAGAISCSGSLWFEGFIDYMKQRRAPEGSSVYLSLGGKEEKCADPVISTIGNCTRLADDILSNDPSVRRNTLEMNKGGHFADSAKRLAKGIKFIIGRSC